MDAKNDVILITVIFVSAILGVITVLDPVTHITACDAMRVDPTLVTR